MTTQASATPRGFDWLPTAGTVLPAAALAYAKHGWPVLPLDGKRPLTDHGLRNATTDEATIRQWWRWWPRANCGLRVPTALVVVDLDGEVGVESWRKLGPFGATLTARTGRGWHLWWAAPEGIELRQDAGRVLPGIDTRVPNKGYLVVPPSIHPEHGTVYEWVRRRPPAPLPEQVVELYRVRPPAPRPHPVPPPQVAPSVRIRSEAKFERARGRCSACGASGTIDGPTSLCVDCWMEVLRRQRAQHYAETAIDNRARELAAMPPDSGRACFLFASWRRAHDAEIVQYLPLGTSRQILQQAARQAGLPESEIQRTLRDLEAVAA